MDNYAPTCDNKHRNCLKCLNCIVNYNRIKKHFKKNMLMNTKIPFQSLF